MTKNSSDQVPQPRQVYGSRRGINLPAALVALALHAALAVILVQARQHFVKLAPERLTVVNLAAPPPPPPKVAPPPRPVPVATPTPIIQLPSPVAVPVPVEVTPDPVPAPPQPPPPVAAAPPPAEPPPLSIVEMSDMGTRMVSARPPAYPIESRRRNEMGTVVLAVTLGFDGGVTNVSVARSSGFKRLDDAACDAVRRWRWSPTLRGGQPVKVVGWLEIPFVLERPGRHGDRHRRHDRGPREREDDIENDSRQH